MMKFPVLKATSGPRTFPSTMVYTGFFIQFLPLGKILPALGLLKMLPLILLIRIIIGTTGERSYNPYLVVTIGMPLTLT